MSLIGNSLLRGVLCRKLYSNLRFPVNAVQIKAQNVGYSTTVVTSKDVVPSGGDEAKGRMNNAAKLFLERAREYDEMIEEAGAEYRIGMRHLANMMGSDPETFTQADADAAIEYLFPSGLNDKKARPFMKPPEQVFPPRKKIQFDRTGRPFHYMFFTGFPNFYQLCHDAVDHMKQLDKSEDKDIRLNKQPNEGLKLNLDDSIWLTKENLQNIIIEDITDKQYENFVAMMERLLTHPYSYQCKDFIMKYRQTLHNQSKEREVIEPKIGEDGRQYVTSYECRFKSCRADVTVISPGTGQIEINGKDINYFQYPAPKETVLFPLHFTNMIDKVDIVATAVDGGYMGQAGAIRYGISLGLRSFVDEATVEDMRVAGLLKLDPRRKERKKPGQEGARRKFTWKKR